MRRRPKRLPERTPEQVREAFPAVRQSRLAEFDNCALATRFGLEGYDFTNHAQARGIIFHKFAEEVLRTLRRTGETSIPVEEALVILYEVCAQRDIPDDEVVVPSARERRLLRICAIKFAAENEFAMDRLIDVERRLHATVTYPDADGVAVERQITGKPDAIVADPPEGAVILDWKTTLQPPPRYNGSDQDTPEGVSYMGYFQQRCYALLVFHNYPSVQRVTLREFYPLAGEARTATVHREQMEHIEREMTAQVELLDRALAGGSKSKLWQPSPGKHCTYCPRPGSCPIEAEARGDGAITSAAQAKRYAAELVVADRVRITRREALKPWVEVHGPVPVKSGKGRYEFRWKPYSTGKGGSYGIHVPDTSDRGPKDASLEDAFAQAAARREAA